MLQSFRVVDQNKYPRFNGSLACDNLCHNFAKEKICEKKNSSQNFNCDNNTNINEQIITFFHKTNNLLFLLLPCVNFINTLFAHFPPIFWRQKIAKPNIIREKLLNSFSYKKRASKMLMKLTRCH